MCKILTKVLCGMLLVGTSYANQLSFQEQFPAPPAGTCNPNTAIACVPVQVDKNTQRCEVQFLGEYRLSKPYEITNNSEVDFSAPYTARINGERFSVRCWRPSNMENAQRELRSKIGMLPRKNDGCDDDKIKVEVVGRVSLNKNSVMSKNVYQIKKFNNFELSHPIDISDEDSRHVTNNCMSFPNEDKFRDVLQKIKNRLNLLAPEKIGAPAPVAVPLSDDKPSHSAKTEVQPSQYKCNGHSKPCIIKGDKCFFSREIKISLPDDKVTTGDKYQNNGTRYGCMSNEKLDKMLNALKKKNGENLTLQD